MDEYLPLGHMREVLPEGTKSQVTYYLPHQAVLKEKSTTTKLRVVFDASAKSSTRLSLNDVMYTVSRLQQNLADILLRWRKHKYVLKADIEKMYRMVGIKNDHQNLQRILWRSSKADPVKEYNLTTVTYGTAAAPYLAVKVLQKLASDESHRFPHTSTVVIKDFYVDDLMTGADSYNEAKKLHTELFELLKSGGFNLRKWASNSKELLRKIPIELREQSIPEGVEINDGETIKTLGIHWVPFSDNFQFKVNIEKSSRTVTKRIILSDIARLFDPLGWLSPVVITAKLMLQELWINGSTWDAEVPSELAREWEEFKRELPLLEAIKIRRWMEYSPTNQRIEIHGFCDASEKAYGAAVYSRVVTDRNEVKLSLLTAKTKVAPIKLKKTLPRLELAGAALLAKLLKQTTSAMELKNVKVYAWTDSTITVAWIRGGPHKWKTFVSNKVSEILTLTEASIWNHVSSKDNPADLASRGVRPSKLADLRIWWEGPSWLKDREENWPTTSPQNFNTIEERKKIQAMHVSTSAQECHNELLVRYSSLPRLLKILSYCNRFLDACRKKEISTQHITSSEIAKSLKMVIRAVQKSAFFNTAKPSEGMQKHTKLLSLNPFIDSEGILRVGGRIENSELSYNEKHPIILPSDHHITKLIILEAHECTLHGPNQMTLAFIRRKYWILRAKDSVRRTLNKCIRCYRYKAQPLTQQMGNLPSHRVRPAKPFNHTGLDYAGPIQIRVSKGRGNKSYKGYIAIFVCLATKAIHIEAVSDLTSQAFLAAFRRFSARRGNCAHLYSDNATTFVGAQKILDKDLKTAIKNNHMATEALALQGVQWHFIPPAAPHFGGIWEAGVKSIKYHLKRIIGDSTLTFEEMSTLLYQIEACLNSRPICGMTEDPADLAVLTPAHFLIGEAIVSPPEPDDVNRPMHTLTRWNLIQRMKTDFWKIWSSDYLNRLQQRPKWKEPRKNVQVGQIVLLKDEQMSPTNWPIARVTNVHPGSDGIVRVVTIKCKGNTILKRPITKICPLPIENEEDKPDMEKKDVKENVSANTTVVCANLKRKASDDEFKEPTVDYRELARKEMRKLKRPSRGPKIRPVSNYDSLVPMDIQVSAFRKYHGMDWKFPSKRPQESYQNDHQRKKCRYRQESLIHHPFIIICLLLLLTKLGRCAYNITHPQPGLYIEQLGESQIKRGTFRIELNFPISTMEADEQSINDTVKKMKTLCSDALQLSKETHCDGLSQHLEVIQLETLENIRLLQTETVAKRTKRGILGKLLETVFGVNDEVYMQIDTLDKNQKQLLQTINHQTNIMLSTLAAANDTETKVARRLSDFSVKISKALEVIKEMQDQWIGAFDNNKLNIHVLSSYQAAENFIDLMHKKYSRVIDAYFQRANILDFITPSTLMKTFNKASRSLPTGIEIVPHSNIKLKTKFSEGSVKIYGFFHIIESSKYDLIKCTAIPQRVKDKVYKALDLPTSIIAINYNTQLYYTLQDSEFQKCIPTTKHNYLCMTTVIRNLESNPNCVIDEIYHRLEKKSCPFREFEVSKVAWKHLYMKNTWLFVANTPTTAALQCNGLRSDLLLNGTGIIKISQECLIRTKFNTLKSEMAEEVSVVASFSKPVNISTTSIVPAKELSVEHSNMEPVLKPADQVFQTLTQEAQHLKTRMDLERIKYQGKAFSGIIITVIITIAILIGARKVYFTWKKQKLTSIERKNKEDTGSFELPSFRPRQNVETT